MRRPYLPIRSDIFNMVISGTPVALFDQHHYALLPWSSWARGKDHVRLLTIDHHSDTFQAFRRVTNGSKAEEPERQRLIGEIDPSDPERVIEAIQRLANDEHIDAAIRSGIIDCAFVVASDGQRALRPSTSAATDGIAAGDQRGAAPLRPPPMRYAMPEHRIVMVDPRTYLRDGVNTEPWPDHVLESEHLEDRLRIYDQICMHAGQPKLLDGPYILDVDLDAFNTGRSLIPDDAETFRRIVKGALGITVAREPECCESLWEQGDAERDGVEASLMWLIGDALRS